MPTDCTRDHESNLYALMDCAAELVRVRCVLGTSLELYLDIVDAAVADTLEVASAIATELSVDRPGSPESHWLNSLGEEPLSYADAVRDVPIFIEQARHLLQSLSAADCVSLCSFSARSFTFALLLRSPNGFKQISGPT